MSYVRTGKGGYKSALGAIAAGGGYVPPDGAAPTGGPVPAPATSGCGTAGWVKTFAPRPINAAISSKPYAPGDCVPVGYTMLYPNNKTCTIQENGQCWDSTTNCNVTTDGKCVPAGQKTSCPPGLYLFGGECYGPGAYITDENCVVDSAGNCGGTKIYKTAQTSSGTTYTAEKAAALTKAANTTTASDAAVLAAYQKALTDAATAENRASVTKLAADVQAAKAARAYANSLGQSAVSRGIITPGPTQDPNSGVAEQPSLVGPDPTFAYLPQPTAYLPQLTVPTAVQSYSVPKDNTTLYIGLGVGAVALIGLVLALKK